MKQKNNFESVAEETSPIVVESLQWALGLSNWITEHHLGSYSHVPKQQVAVALYSIGIDHREACILLLTHGARTSGFALARSVFEAFLRGLWAETCMTEEDYKAIQKTRSFPKFDTISAKLNKAHDKKKPIFGSIQKTIWGTLSDFSHGGYGQVTRWLTDDGIEPAHSDEEVIDIMDLIDLYGLSCSWQLSLLAGWPIGDYPAKATELLERFQAHQTSREVHEKKI